MRLWAMSLTNRWTTIDMIKVFWIKVIKTYRVWSQMKRYPIGEQSDQGVFKMVW